MHKEQLSITQRRNIIISKRFSSRYQLWLNQSNMYNERAPTEQQNK